MSDCGNQYEVFGLGAFDDVRIQDIRFLQEVDRLLGNVRVLLYSDQVVEKATGKPPKFLLNERQYYLKSIRYVTKTSVTDQIVPALSQELSKHHK